VALGNNFAVNDASHGPACVYVFET